MPPNHIAGDLLAQLCFKVLDAIWIPPLNLTKPTQSLDLLGWVSSSLIFKITHHTIFTSKQNYITALESSWQRLQVYLLPLHFVVHLIF